MKKIIAACCSLVVASGLLISVSSCGPSHKTPSEPGTQSDSTRMQNSNSDTTMSTDTSHHQPGGRR